MACAFCFARLKAGSSIAARMAMMAMTTSNSMSVKPFRAAVRESGFSLVLIRMCVMTFCI